MELDATSRFSSRVDDYIRYRPGYPRQIVPLIERECGLRPGAPVADIGSGTGLSAALFLEAGCEVWGVEPNADMRAAGERLLAGHSRFHSVDGRAEDTGLGAASVNLVLAGQSFHWFDQAAAQAEFRRILRPPGWVALAWNERLVEGRFLEEYEALLHRYGTDYDRIDHRQVGAEAMDRFFGPGHWRLATFPNEQRFNLEGVLGRLHSSSYAPPAGTEAYERINEEVTRLFAECQKGGEVAFRYATNVYYGRVK